MIMRSRTLCAVLLSTSLYVPALQAQEGILLDLAAAERLALEQDAGLSMTRAEARALREQAVADGQLPDPALSLGLMNLPVDSLDRREEGMTQLTVGIRQSFPPGETRQHRSARTGHQATAADAGTAARRLEVLRETRLAWLELAYQQAALELLQLTHSRFDDILDVTRSRYRTGGDQLQDVLGVELEQALLADRIAATRGTAAAALAGLRRWTGPLAGQPRLPAPPQLATPPELEPLRARLTRHPLIAAANARVAAGQAGVEVARQQYKPGWMLDVSYGERSGMGRSDMFSAMVTLDLPIFTGQRQDRRVAASVAETDALHHARDELHRELLLALESDHARWQELHAREQGYEDRILPAARNNADSALDAYRNGVTDFTTLIRAQLTELESRLQAQRTRTERLQAQARLLYFLGEDS
ncbi:MAG: TolC family protein [Gammaproteobacteria bacterium]|nr:TolC family protein [Gammaproteobacteria bacterium]